MARIVPVFYWGDLDTHGFAIFPHAVFFLMDKETLAQHKGLWGKESRQENRDLNRLSRKGAGLYAALRGGHYGEHVRLEQERISFGWVRASIMRIMHPLTSKA